MCHSRVRQNCVKQVLATLPPITPLRVLKLAINVTLKRRSVQFDSKSLFSDRCFKFCLFFLSFSGRARGVNKVD